jgi:hypothetical protein
MREQQLLPSSAAKYFAMNLCKGDWAARPQIARSPRSLPFSGSPGSRDLRVLLVCANAASSSEPFPRLRYSQLFTDSYFAFYTHVNYSHTLTHTHTHTHTHTLSLSSNPTRPLHTLPGPRPCRSLRPVEYWPSTRTIAGNSSFCSSSLTLCIVI